MILVFKKKYPHAAVEMGGGGDIEIRMDFDDAAEISHNRQNDECKG